MFEEHFPRIWSFVILVRVRRKLTRCLSGFVVACVLSYVFFTGVVKGSEIVVKSTETIARTSRHANMIASVRPEVSWNHCVRDQNLVFLLLWAPVNRSRVLGFIFYPNPLK